MNMCIINGKVMIKPTFKGENRSVAKIRIEQSILDGRKGTPEHINKILDEITVSYYIANF